MSDHDVIVVGAGGSGGPLAARLSEDPNRRVLLLEAGPAPATEDFPDDLLDPGLMTGYLPGHPNNWAHAARLTDGKPHPGVARGKVIGGSTALNGTYFIRARKHDFDAYAALGNDEWAFDRVLPFYERLERDLDFGDAPGHGSDGPVPVTRATEAEITPYSRAFIDAALGAGFVWESDKNGEQPPGVGLLPTNALDGIRMSTALTYINPARDRANFQVQGDTLVQRVLFDGFDVRGVEALRDGETVRYDAPLVVLSAGAFKSPHLLALSGIGPRAELEAAGIPVLVDLPGVGKKFSDHPSIPLNWTPRHRLDDDDLRFAFQTVLHDNSSSSRHDGDVELLPMMRTLMALIGLPRGEVDDLTLAISIQADSRGDITTVSANAADEPLIEYRYLESDRDRSRLRDAVRLASRLLRSEAFAAHFDRFVDLDEAALEDDEALDAWMTTVLDTGIHAAGSCGMGDDPAAGHVVDQRGRVFGVSGLRVADTSILPFTPSRGPSATSMLIGERVADLIVQDTARLDARGTSA